MSIKVINQKMLMKTLDWSYEKALTGIPTFDSATEMADNYMLKTKSPRKAANSLIRWQNTKAGTSGFITGFGGFVVMPLTIPINLASVLYIQLRMIAAIAHIGGYDLKDDRVRTLAYTCLAGNGAKDILKDVGIVVGRKMTTEMIKNISGKTLIAINKKVGFRLLTKFGEKGVINLGKAVPIAGGIIGGAFDGFTTNAIGNIARNTFIEKIESKEKAWHNQVDGPAIN